jgi:hypothetical protein
MFCLWWRAKFAKRSPSNLIRVSPKHTRLKPPLSMVKKDQESTIESKLTNRDHHPIGRFENNNYLKPPARSSWLSYTRTVSLFTWSTLNILIYIIIYVYIYHILPWSITNLVSTCPDHFGPWCRFCSSSFFDRLLWVDQRTVGETKSVSMVLMPSNLYLEETYAANYRELIAWGAALKTELQLGHHLIGEYQPSFRILGSTPQDFSGSQVWPISGSPSLVQETGYLW